MLVRYGCARFRGGGIVLREFSKAQRCLVILGLWTVVFGVASVEARPLIRISVALPDEVKIRVESLPPRREWSFRNAYAGVLGIAERVEQFQAYGVEGEDRKPKRIAAGEFRADVDVFSISYVVKLPPQTAADVSHVSWIAGESGVLMLADLLPENLSDVDIQFSLPSGWTIEPGAQSVAEPEKAVFVIGRSLRKQSRQVGGIVLEAVLSGEWPFKEATVTKAAAEVLEKYVVLTGYKLASKSVVMIAPLPVAAGGVKWRAETRGSTVLLLIDQHASIQNWPGQLGVIFTHELLHLWVPNSLSLQGDYDWFFEGFTLYTALVTALDLRLITFNEYLATLARVYDSYLSRPDDLSLIDASERRWTSGSPAVYDKGMLLAFLYDLTMTKDSGGRDRLLGIYRDLFRRHGSAGPDTANEAIIALLSSTPASAALAKTYIEGSRELELEPALTAYGLRLDPTGKNSTLSINKKLRADQKHLLKALGYR